MGAVAILEGRRIEEVSEDGRGTAGCQLLMWRCEGLRLTESIKASSSSVHVAMTSLVSITHGPSLLGKGKDGVSGVMTIGAYDVMCELQRETSPKTTHVG